jgi:hypothetical protein
MNWITILGIVIIALGTLLTYYGSSLSSENDKKEITDKIDSFNKNIERVKNENITQSEKDEKIKKIQEEFNSWAEQFEKKKEEHKIAIDKNDVNLREKKAQLNSKWHESYAVFFSSLTEMVTAINKVNGQRKITFIENPKFPANIYDASVDKFKVIIQFDKNVYWFIWLNIREPLNDNNIPTIEISVSDKAHYYFRSWGDLSIKVVPDRNEIRIFTMNIFDKAGFESEYKLEPNTNQLTSLLKKAFEYQIILIEK